MSKRVGCESGVVKMVIGESWRVWGKGVGYDRYK